MAAVDNGFRQDIEARMRAVERTLLEHVTKCDGRARTTQWMIFIGFAIVIVMVGSEGPVGKAIAAVLAVTK